MPGFGNTPRAGTGWTYNVGRQHKWLGVGPPEWRLVQDRKGQLVFTHIRRLPDDVWYLVFKHLENGLDFKTAGSYRKVCHLWYTWIKKVVPMLDRAVRFRSQGNVADVAREAGTVWTGPENVTIRGDRDRGHELRHLATFAATFARRWTRASMLSIERAQWRAAYTTPTLFRDLSLYNITKLDLYNVTFPNAETFARLILYLPHLESVYCISIEFSAADVPFRPPALPASLRTRRQPGVEFWLRGARRNAKPSITGADSKARQLLLFRRLGEFLHHADHLSPFLRIFTSNTLRHHLRVEDYPVLLQTLLDNAGSSLRGIDISIFKLSHDDESQAELTQLVPSISIAKNTQLRRVELSFRRREDYPFAAHILSSVASTSIREIQLNLKGDTSSSHEAANIDRFSKECLSPIDRVLTASDNKFIDLELVKVCWSHSLSPAVEEYWRTYGRSYFPELCKYSEVRLEFSPLTA